MARQLMPISSRWWQGAVLTYLVGFTVLGVLAYLVYRDQPPIPARVVAGDKVLFTRDDIVGGMHVFQRYGLTEYGSVYGHGAYLGPDFTAEYLHMSAEFLIKAYAGALAGGLSARERVAVELHANTYNPEEGAQLFGVPVAAKGLQPVWWRIENHEWMGPDGIRCQGKRHDGLPHPSGEDRMRCRNYW